jgi:hypothetical protein
MVTPYRQKPLRNRVAISTRDLARRMRKRLNKTTEGIEAAVAKVKNNAETAIKELEANGPDGRGLCKAFSRMDSRGG